MNSITIGIRHILINLCNDEFSCLSCRLCIIDRNTEGTISTFIWQAHLNKSYIDW